MSHHFGSSNPRLQLQQFGSIIPILFLSGIHSATIRRFPDCRRLKRILGEDALVGFADAGGSTTGALENLQTLETLGVFADAGDSEDLRASSVLPAPAKNPAPPLGGAGHTGGQFKKLEKGT